MILLTSHSCIGVPNIGLSLNELISCGISLDFFEKARGCRGVGLRRPAWAEQVVNVFLQK